MTTYFVSRHPGAAVWAARNGVEATRLDHLDPAMIVAGDTVIGTLPIQIAADVTARGARYFHLEINIPPDMRGLDLSAGDMERLGAKLTEFHIARVKT